MTPELLKDHNFEKQMQRQIGCMAGFLQIFDRQQVLIGKRLYSAKRLPPSPSVDSTSESEKSVPASPVISEGFGKQVLSRTKVTTEATVMADFPSPKSSLPFPIVELKEGNRSPWKFNKEAPRLSLDSRATTDAKGGLHPTAGSGQHNRSPSVIARLMGLEPLPDSSTTESESKPELRRSASESRVTKELIQSRFTGGDGTGFYSNYKQPIQPPPSSSISSGNVMRDNSPIRAHYADPMNQSLKNGEQIRGFNNNRGYTNSPPPWRPPPPPPQRQSFFDSRDIFPEPKQSVSIYGEIERRLRTGGMNEPSKDLETLKQILEALQLKGLLHPKQPFQQHQIRHQNYVYDESPIVLLKSNPTRRTGHEFPPFNARNQIRRNYSLAGDFSPSVSPRRERIAPNPIRSSRSTSSSPTTQRNEGNSTPRRLNAAGNQRKLNQSPEANRKSSPVQQDPKINNRRNKSTAGIHCKEKKTSSTTTIVTEDESSSSSTSGSSSNNSTEVQKGGEKESGSLLERCDKLLHSIAEMAGTGAGGAGTGNEQPSPVSVLDPSMYQDEVLTPSPVTTKRRSINFKDEESDEEIWSPVVSPIRSKYIEPSSLDVDFVYVSDILRASHYLPDSSDVFLLLEKQQYLKGSDMSRPARLHRRLIFDTIDEIMNRNKPLPPWENINAVATIPSLDKVWSEFQRIQEHETKDDLFEVVNDVMKKDLSGPGWGNQAIEKSEGVLDIERLIFKDLICEAIRDLAASRYSKGTLLSTTPMSSPQMMMSRRKLSF